MQCERCGQRPATTHITRNINGQETELHLCSECAKQLGAGMFGGFPLEGIWQSLFAGAAASPAAADSKRCPGCGMSFDEIAASAKVGCARCYETFYEPLLPSLQRIHGKATHAGKVPSTASKEVRLHSRIAALKGELSAAIERQAFERAAKLRDELRALEGENGNERD